MRIAVAQLRCDAHDHAARRSVLETAIGRAARDEADLVVLPELAASGYRLDREHLEEVAEPIDGTGRVLASWRAAASRHDVAVIGGFAERRADGRLANTVVVVDRDGSILGAYRKLHLFAGERDVFAPGDLGLPIFRIGDTDVGVLVCYDLRFPEAARILALRDAEVIAVPTAWVAGFDRPAPPAGDEPRGQPALSPENAMVGQVRGALVQANLNQVFIACADQVGREGRHEFLGRSLVADPFGAPLAGPLSPDAEEVVTVEIDVTDVRAARHRGPGIDPRGDRRTDVYGELLGYRAPLVAAEFPGTESA